jgi:hypothetical protein
MTDNKTLNVYQKLQAVRVGILDTKPKKSGSSPAGWDKDEGCMKYRVYFETSDFMPTADKLMAEIGATTVLNYDVAERETWTPEKEIARRAVLEFINTDKPDERITCSCLMSTANMGPNMHSVQNAGAVQTYLKRYLYLTLFDINEDDALDAKGAEPKADAPKAEPPKAEPPKGNKPPEDEKTKAEPELGKMYKGLLDFARKQGYIGDLKGDDPNDMAEFVKLCKQLKSEGKITTDIPYVDKAIVWTRDDLKAVGIALKEPCPDLPF